VRRDEIQALGGQPPGTAHGVEILGRMNLDVTAVGRHDISGYFLHY
jgi:hypothetical protein